MVMFKRVLCILFIESPYFDNCYAKQLDQIAAGGGGGNINSSCQIINLIKGKGFKLSNENISVEITSPKMDSGNLNQQSQKWKISFESGKEKKTLVVVRQKGYLFIPELSIFDAFKGPNRLVFKKLSDLKRRIHWQFYVIGILIFLFNLRVLDVNITSPHGFYRDRLSKAYVFQEKEDGSISSNDDQKLSELNRDD